ncbi:MAG: lycopene cyclase domain-containing protein [Chitinophagales bacterium]|nr:lycopene cyclase domain-containing protein [Bacteroidota bacterium]MCB9256723.1 lycopene cyclase domain-containing protein [Chitinophagales bacterium]
MKIDSHLYYLLAMLASIFFPLVLSFDRKVNFSQYFKDLIFSIPIVAILFTLGDMLYTYLGVWGFNSNYHLAYFVFNLPLEEISFFFFVPYACLFIYEVIRAYFPCKSSLYLNTFLLLLSLVMALLAYIYSNKLYTSLSFSFSAAILVLMKWKNYPFNANLLLAYLLSILPFLLVNGFLTGMFMDEAIVWYNAEEIMGYRCLSIPIEDFSYSFNLISLNIILFESLKKRRANQVQ